jgi:hypothetical protein
MQRAELLLHLHDGEAGIRVADESFETQVLESRRPAAMSGLVSGKNPRRHCCQAVTFRFVDNDPAVRVLGCARAFLFSLVNAYGDLPLEVAALQEFCNPRDDRFVDRDRKFEWRHNQATVAFGRNRGRSLKEMAKEDPGFLEWILKSDFTQETKEIAKKALHGEFPERPVALESPA